ncbi:hypothetical protein F6455_17895 [Proteobacteria bacterium 005FR1]|nr:hypothetical protein [Proteobacteria bacterium 005FR1]
MRLRYDKSITPDAKPLVLSGPEQLRVEIHIRRDPEDTFTLLAFSGPQDSGEPQKSLQQGPFHRLDQAIAAKRAIVAQLRDAGFEIADQQHAMWSMAAQRAVNASRKEKAEAVGDYRFDPKDVYLDW